MLQHWTDFFDAMGLPWQSIESNKNAVSLPAIAGAPVFRAVKNQQELAKLHQVAKAKSAEMGRILVLGLPLTAPTATVTLPGELLLPKVRAYGGNIASTFSLCGHKIESTLLVNLKSETLKVMAEGTKTKTPLLDWLLTLAGSSWVYGKPSSLNQLDTLLGLVCRDPNAIGHVRTRQLSFGRGCADAMLLPLPTVELRNHSLDQKISQADFRFIGLESEMACKAKGRDRVLAYVSNCFLSSMHKHSEKMALALGAGQLLGGSVIGKRPVDTKPTISADSVSSTNKIMAGL